MEFNGRGTSSWLFCGVNYTLSLGTERVCSFLSGLAADLGWLKEACDEVRGSSSRYI